MDRRKFIKATLVGISGSSFAAWNDPGVVHAEKFGMQTLHDKSHSTPETATLTAGEQSALGTSEWKLGSVVNGVEFYRADDERNQIRGYASKPSVVQGATIDFHISVNSASPKYRIEVFRIGDYGGVGARLITMILKSNGTRQVNEDLSNLIVDSTTGKVECGWLPSHSLFVDSSWASGIYWVRLTNAERFQSAIVFCVRNENASAPILCIQPTLTYQAYNGYPNVKATSNIPIASRVGRSLYADVLSSAAHDNELSGSKAAVSVSFDRPYTMDLEHIGNVGSGVSFDTYTYEPFFIRWAESNGYNVDYATDTDIDALGIDLLEQYQIVVIPGHAEYLTRNIRDSFEQARNQNVRLAFLGANAAYWQVRLEAATSPLAVGKTVVGYKERVSLDPLANTLYQSGNFVNVGRKDSSLVGVGYVKYGRPEVVADLIVANANHWIWGNSGLQNGARIKGIVGYEIDSVGDPPARTGSHVLLSESSYFGELGQSSYYQPYSGGGVFGAGTMLWAWGLAHPITYDGLDPSFAGVTMDTAYASTAIQAATGNILSEALTDHMSRSRNLSIAKAIGETTHVRYADDSGWSSWESLNGQTNAAPAFVFQPNGDADVFVTGLSNSLWVFSRRQNLWHGWTRLSADNDIQGGPSATLSSGGSVMVGVLSPSTMYFVRSCNDVGWGEWINLGGQFLGRPTLLSYGDVTDVFGIGVSHDVLTRAIVQGVPYGDWISLGGVCSTSTAAVVNDSHGTRLLVVIGANGHVWTRMQDAGSGVWGSWTDLGQSSTSTPSVVSPCAGRFDIVIKSSVDNSIWTRTWAIGQWWKWISHGGEIVDFPTVTSNKNAIFAHCLGTPGAEPWLLSIDATEVELVGEWTQA